MHLRMMPRSPMFQHRIENHQELVHAGRERDFLGFASPTETLMERADDGIEARGDDRTV